MASTETTVRNVIVAAIQAIAVTDLGFDNANGNVKDYLIDWERPEKYAQYLYSSVATQKVVRCWAVQVAGHDEWYATGNQTARTYTIDVVAYYQWQSGGTDINTLTDHARKVRNAIRGLQSNLGGTVDRVLSNTPFTTELKDGLDDKLGLLIEGRTTYVADVVSPDW